MTEPVATEEVEINRVFEAPRERVYAAFTDPDQVASWFGPVGFSVPRDTVDMDVRPGGHQRLVMVNDEDPSMKSPVDATYTDVVENELIAGEEDWDGVPGLQPAGTVRIRIEFHDEGGNTRLDIKQGPYSDEMARMTREGWGSSFTKLDDLLAG